MHDLPVDGDPVEAQSVPRAYGEPAGHRSRMLVAIAVLVALGALVVYQLRRPQYVTAAGVRLQDEPRVARVLRDHGVAHAFGDAVRIWADVKVPPEDRARARQVLAEDARRRGYAVVLGP